MNFVWAAAVSILLHVAGVVGWFLLAGKQAETTSFKTVRRFVVRLPLGEAVEVEGVVRASPLLADPVQSAMVRSPVGLETANAQADPGVAGSMGEFWSLKEVDAPPVPLDALDFELALKGVVVPDMRTRVWVFINAEGRVEGVEWPRSGVPPWIAERLDEYIKAQRFKPAVRQGQAVGSRLGFEFALGELARPPEDLIVIPTLPPSAAPPASAPEVAR